MGMFSKSRPQAALSNQEQAMLNRNRSLLDEEIEESEKRLKAMSRGKLGYKSLLKGSSPTAASSAAPTQRRGLGIKQPGGEGGS